MCSDIYAEARFIRGRLLGRVPSPAWVSASVCARLGAASRSTSASPPANHDGGAALCCDDGTKTTRGMNCTCDPSNLDAFVCQPRPEMDWVASPEAIAMARAESEAAMAYTPPPKPAVNAAADGKPNVVMFFVDDSGYADSQVYGAPSTQTPAINKMAAEGARFTQVKYGPLL